MEEQKVLAIALFGFTVRDVNYDKTKVFGAETPVGKIIDWANGAKEKEDHRMIGLSIRFED